MYMDMYGCRGWLFARGLMHAKIGSIRTSLKLAQKRMWFMGPWAKARKPPSQKNHRRRPRVPSRAASPVDVPLGWGARRTRAPYEHGVSQPARLRGPPLVQARADARPRGREGREHGGELNERATRAQAYRSEEQKYNDKRQATGYQPRGRSRSTTTRCVALEKNKKVAKI